MVDRRRMAKEACRSALSLGGARTFEPGVDDPGNSDVLRGTLMPRRDCARRAVAPAATIPNRAMTALDPDDQRRELAA